MWEKNIHCLFRYFREYFILRKSSEYKFNYSIIELCLMSFISDVHNNPNIEGQPEEHGYFVEGIGYDFIPKVLEGIDGVNPNARVKLIDYWLKSSDRESFMMARRMIRDEGLLCGGSCGSAMVGAIQACKFLGLKKGQRCVVILADSTRNYMTKFLKDEWMQERTRQTRTNTLVLKHTETTTQLEALRNSKG